MIRMTDKKETKIVDCVVCGYPLIVSKFASPAKSRCHDCKNVKEGSTNWALKRLDVAISTDDRKMMMDMGNVIMGNGADIDFDIYIACMYGIRESKLEEYVETSGMIDGNWEEYIDELGEEGAKQRGIDSMIQNEIDTWVDYLRANGHDDRQPDWVK